jgi:hypothetical protein
MHRLKVKLSNHQCHGSQNLLLRIVTSRTCGGAASIREVVPALHRLGPVQESLRPKLVRRVATSPVGPGAGVLVRKIRGCDDQVAGFESVAIDSDVIAELADDLNGVAQAEAFGVDGAEEGEMNEYRDVDDCEASLLVDCDCAGDLCTDTVYEAWAGEDLD